MKKYKKSLKKANELFFSYFFCGLEANSSDSDNYIQSQ